MHTDRGVSGLESQGRGPAEPPLGIEHSWPRCRWLGRSLAGEVGGVGYDAVLGVGVWAALFDAFVDDYCLGVLALKRRDFRIWCCNYRGGHVVMGKYQLSKAETPLMLRKARIPTRRMEVYMSIGKIGLRGATYDRRYDDKDEEDSS